MLDNEEIYADPLSDMDNSSDSVIVYIVYSVW